MEVLVGLGLMSARLLLSVASSRQPPSALLTTLLPCPPLLQLAFQRIRELQSAVEDARLEASAKDGRLAELEALAAEAQVGGDRAGGSTACKKDGALALQGCRLRQHPSMPPQPTICLQELAASNRALQARCDDAQKAVHSSRESEAQLQDQIVRCAGLVGWGAWGLPLRLRPERTAPLLVCHASPIKAYMPLPPRHPAAWPSSASPFTQKSPTYRGRCGFAGVLVGCNARAQLACACLLRARSPPGLPDHLPFAASPHPYTINCRWSPCRNRCGQAG